MKKVWAKFMACAMITTMTAPAFASETVLTISETGEQIIESIDDYQQITRVYERSNDADLERGISSGADEYAQIKEILLELGMEQDFIDKLSDKNLEEYAASPQLVGTTTYIKIDSENNEVYLSEATALREVAEIQLQAEIEEPEADERRLMVQDTYEDSYMRVFYLVTYLGNGSYKFSTDARWLTMPFIRSYDLIGACAQNATVTNSSRSGWYAYDRHYSYITNKYYSESYNISSSSFKNATNGSWYGSAAIIRLPIDAITSTSSNTYYNYKAHYEYTGHVNSPKAESWFNSVGSYSHSTTSISSSIGASISTSGASASIGLNVTKSVDTRSAEVELHYLP